MIRKDEKERFYSPLFHLLSRIIFQFTLCIVILYNICISRIRIRGRKHLCTETKGAFLISNHTLYLDPGIIAHAVAPRRTYFTAMEKTFLIRIIGSFIRYLGAFPVSGEMPYNLFIKNIKKILDKGNFVHFFPEGELTLLHTRVKDFKNGVFFLAFKLNRPVIPVKMTAIPRSCLSKTLNYYFCKVTVDIYRPVYPSEFKNNSLKPSKQIRMMADYCRSIMCGDPDPTAGA